VWEYTYIEDGDIKKAVERANKLGKDRWEAFGYTTLTGAMGRGKHVILLKRPK
jgi:hypothetical protein